MAKTKAVTVTLSDDVVATIERLDATTRQLLAAGEMLNQVAETLHGLNLTLDDIAGVIAARAGTSKTAVKKVFTFLRQAGRDPLTGDEVVAHHLAAKTGVRITEARRMLAELRGLVKDVEAQDAEA